MSQPSEKAPRVPDLGRFCMGEWEVNQAENALFSEGRCMRVEPRVMDVLAYLAAESGRVVSKDELLTAVWDGAFVEEGVLAQAVHSLRKALGDDARQPRYIQTIPKRGYRLVAPVELEQGAQNTVSEVSPFALSRSPSGASLTPVIKRGYRAWPFVVVAAVAVALVLRLSWHQEDGIRIVVLPFENLDQPKDSYFAAGLTEEIMANLTLLPTVQVIPGKSVLGDKEVAKPISEIAEELGADFVLQGNVRWQGRQIRVTPKLIRVRDETIVLATPFTADARHPFSAQQEISRAVISTLDITLTPEQNQAVGERSTKNAEAYRAYVQGLVLKDQPFYSPKYLSMAAQMFERAVDMDPGFAEAWAELSQIHSYLAYNTDRSTQRRVQARHAMDRAVALGPDLVATRLAQAYFSYRCLEDYGAALEHLNTAARMAPNLVEVHETRGLLLRRLGRYSEAIEMLKLASALKPRTADMVWPIAETYGALRDYAQADFYFEQAISLAPDEPFNYEQRALNRLAWKRNLSEARSILEDSPVYDSPQLQLAAVQFDLYRGKYQQALARLSSESIKKLSPADQTRLAAMSVIAHERLGDQRRALALAEASVPTLKLRMGQYPRHPLFRVYLAVALAQLGRGQEALAQAEQAVQQSEHDAFSGPRVVEVQAMVASILGKRREAVSLLGRLLSTPYRDPISATELLLDPIWDPLRGDPEFESLLQ
ncbi:MAG TPA: winged helix-turn-helix domain-containing protein [Thermoanaerobaculia bacterium]|nr:winged helix-turn-helix domain-containing protein [Thermoanaerobaculia bacterium]